MNLKTGFKLWAYSKAKVCNLVESSQVSPEMSFLTPIWHGNYEGRENSWLFSAKNHSMSTKTFSRWMTAKHWSIVITIMWGLSRCIELHNSEIEELLVRKVITRKEKKITVNFCIVHWKYDNLLDYRHSSFKLCLFLFFKIKGRIIKLESNNPCDSC